MFIYAYVCYLVLMNSKVISFFVRTEIYFHLAPKFSEYNEKPNPTIFFSIHCCIENMNATQFELGVKPA